MPKFYREAILAAGCIEQPAIDPNSVGALETWEEVANELDKLTFNQRCHAIYADWLLQLRAVGGDTQIRMRNLLLVGDALAANYLAEFAQNADDAGSSSMMVYFADDWLVVANSGNSLSSLDTVGLNRLFVGFKAGGVPIGKFGIGFKSCHHIANEVYVRSWGQDGFGFRLPISHSGDQESMPDAERLRAILDGIARVTDEQPGRTRPFDIDQWQDQTSLGHCTPEALPGISDRLPPRLRELVELFQRNHHEHGVWFALHLHEEGQRKARERISEQAEVQYELAPLFLRNLRSVTLQNRTMRMLVGRPIGTAVGKTAASSVTLEISTPGENNRNDRLLLLSSGANPTWKIALPADGDFKLKQPNADAFSIKSGGGYAFLPLPGLNWPWPVHLHLNAPTNLARSDWNPSDAAATHALLREAAEHCAAWLATNRDCWHSDWQPADLINLPLSELPADSSARIFGEAYANKLSEVPTMRTLWGGFVALNAAIGLQLEPGDAVRRAWSNLAAIIPDDLKNEYPLVLNSGGAAHLVERTLNTQQAQAFFRRIRDCLVNAPTESWQNYVRIVVGTEVSAFGGISRGEMIENTLGSMEMAKAYEGVISFRDSAELKFVVQLKPEWHQLFASLSNWIDPNWALAGTTVFGFRMSQVFRLLSQLAEIPTGWDEVIRMTEADFRRAGDAFWQQHRVECPASLRTTVIESIWIESGQDWDTLTDVWIGEEPISMMRGIVALFARRSGELDNKRRKLIESKLQLWGLTEKYESLILERVEALSFEEFHRRLDEDHPANPDRLRMLILRDDWKPDRIPPAWRESVVAAATKAVSNLLQRAFNPVPRGKTLLVGDSEVVAILSWLPEFLPAPKWLKPEGVRWLEERGIFRQLGLEYVVLDGLNSEAKAELGEKLLKGYRHWDPVQISEHHLHAIVDLFREATNTWTVGYPGGVDKRLNEHCVWIEPQNAASAVSPQECILAAADGHDLNGGRFLPETLTRVPGIRGKCFQISDLNPEAFSMDDDEATPLAEAEIPDALAQNLWFQRLRQLCPRMSIVSIPGHQKLRWKRGDLELVIRKAPFGLCQVGNADAIFISDASRRETPESGSRYLPVLVAYAQVAPEDKVIASAVRRNRGLRKIYLENRSKIRARLVQAHATDMGYEAKHVTRELLQNAESAYASRRVELLPAERTFEIAATPENQGASWSVEVTHFGRAFNEQDKAGRDRSDDIERLCALSALHNRTAEEVGRFNRGFKSIFHVTEEVHVISGGYDFKIEDLLLLDPAEPLWSDVGLDQGTRFSFKVSPEKKSALFRETGGRENAFESIELVFLRYVSQIDLRIGGQCDRRFEFHRNQHLDDWQTLRIVEIAGSRNEESTYLVCHKREEGGQRLAVAIRIDEDGLPVPVPENDRFLYRTFPLQQKSSWFPFLINSDDFLTDHGRTGLSPNSVNEALIVRGLKVSLSLLREKIRICEGSIESWLSWVRILERRRLMDGAATLQSQRRDFEDVVSDFDGWLLKHLPDGAQLRPSSAFVFPSSLLRRLHDSEWCTVFGIESASWIAQEVAKVSSDFGGVPQSFYSLRMQVALLVAQGADKESLRKILEEISNLEFAQDLISAQEIESAFELLARHQVVELRALLDFLPEDILSQDEEGEIGEGIETSDLNIGWDEHEALQEFSLAGWMGRLVFDCEEPGTPDQQRLIFASPDTQKGKECWHRLLCLGSLLGARARPQTVRRFWAQQLRSRAIFSATGEHELAKLLDEVSHRTFTDLDTTGENAEMWRRVFYDFQKLRLFVFVDDLPGSFLEHLRSSEEWDAPINFLKSGFRKNESRWAGSVGQSMTAPLFWIVRELRRIRLIEDPVFDPSCCYVNGPARRVLRRLPGFEGYDLRDYGFEKLLGLSQRCHELLNHDFPNHFDLPLQWYALNNR